MTRMSALIAHSEQLIAMVSLSGAGKDSVVQRWCDRSGADWSGNGLNYGVRRSQFQPLLDGRWDRSAGLFPEPMSL